MNVTPKSRYVKINGIKLHLVMAGPDDGRLVILLHGFPEYWYGWRHQIPHLAAKGFRVWAPDQRGYNLSDKPKAVRDYALDELAEDVVGLIDEAGEKKIYLVGHDWGAAVAWWVATRYPERLHRLVTINGPHPAAMRSHLYRSFRQLRKSWYILFFQLPWLPEAFARAGNWHQILQALKKSSHPGTFSDADFKNYREAWSRPAAFRSMVHWYRAALRYPPAPPPDWRITVPTLLIWGAQDKFLGRELARMSIGLCCNGKLRILEEATHWVQHEEPGEVSRLITSFFA
jgi:pimeloyl-ACP methyl ester carboxylesterase